MVIDAFCHILFPSVAGTVKPGTEWRYSDPEARIKYMDRFGIDMEVLSVSPHLYKDGDVLDITRRYHDSLSALIDKHPERFSGVASLPTMDGEFLDELDRAIGQLGLKGCFIYSNIFGKPVDSPEFLPFWESMAKYDLPVLLHPGGWQYFPWIEEFNLIAVFGRDFDTSVGMGRIVFGGILERFPNLKIITHHLGAMVPLVAGRIPAMAERYGTGNNLTKPPIEYFKMFYGDTAVGGNMGALKIGVDFFGVDKVLFATDYPWGPGNGDPWTASALKNVKEFGFSIEELAKVFETNARKLYKI